MPLVRILSAPAEAEVVATCRAVREVCDRIRALEPLLLAQLIGGRGDSGGIAGLIRSIMPAPSASAPPVT